MEEYLRKLAAAPLANPLSINLPDGKRKIGRGPKQVSAPREGDLTPQQVRENRAKEVTAKQGKLLDYYATTEIPAKRVAEHVGLWRMDQNGTDDEGQPIYVRVLDVEGAQRALDARRK